MKFEVETKMVPKTYLKFETGEEFSADELFEILEELIDCDGYIQVLVIYNDAIAKWLEDNGLAHRNVKGSYGPTKKLEEVMGELREQYYNYLDSK